MIEIQVDRLLAGQGRTFYWLSKETGISHTTLWRLKKGKARGINFDTLEKICVALACQTGDVLILANTKEQTRVKTGKRSSSNSSSKKKPAAGAPRALKKKDERTP